MDRFTARIGGAEVALRYSVNAMCAMEDVAQTGLERLSEKEYTVLRLLLWGGMIEERPGFSLIEAGDLIDRHIDLGGTFAEISEACTEALRRAGYAI